MTIIWAKQIKGKRNLFADDALTIWWGNVCSSSKNYRSKIRDLPRAKHYTLIASAGTCRESDLIYNFLDKELWKAKYDTSLELLDVIQQIVIDWCKILKEISEDNPSFHILLLDVELNTCYFIEEFSVRVLSENVEIVSWSWETLFYKVHSLDSSLSDDDKFKSDIIYTASIADWCACPIFQTNWEDFWSYDKEWNILTHKHMNL